MRISYAIPVCNEHMEIDRLLNQLTKGKRPQDEIVVQADSGNVTSEVMRVLAQYGNQINVVQFPLNGDFASFKNNLKANCTGEWIYQIDADEYLQDVLLEHLPTILQDNPTVEVFIVPRINTVEGLTQEHIQRWRWNVNEKGWVNFPDYQTRILQNAPHISWKNKVHEILLGHRSQALLPAEEEYCLLHHKDIKRQESQNAHYDIINQLKNG